MLSEIKQSNIYIYIYVTSKLRDIAGKHHCYPARRVIYFFNIRKKYLIKKIHFQYENNLRKLIKNLGTLPSVNKSVTNRACVLCTMS